MSRFSWLKSCRRQLPRSVAQREIQVANGSTLQKMLLLSRALQNCGYATYTRRPTDSELSGMQLRYRSFHATGSSKAPEQSYYDILGVSENASRDEIKKAFHSLAKKYHPDANKNNPSAKRKFQEIRQAYETLHDSQKREVYDNMKRSRSSRNVEFDGESEGFTSDYKTHFSSRSFHDVFSEIFEEDTDGFPSDIQMELVLTFAEAAKGCTKDLSFKAYNPCDFCGGIGHPPDAKATICPTCRGLGKVTIPPFTTRCSTCKGFGKFVKENCMKCMGSGVCQGTKRVNVTIPAGVESGDTVRIPRGGNAGRRGSEPSSIYINLKVLEDRTFARDGADIYVDSRISFTQAVLGGMVEVPTLTGSTQVKIPKGVQHGQLLVLRGKGLPKHGLFGSHGNQYVKFRINFPSELNERQRAIMEELAMEEINNENNPSGEESRWSKLLEIMATYMTSSRFMVDLSVFILILILFVR